MKLVKLAMVAGVALVGFGAVGSSGFAEADQIPGERVQLSSAEINAALGSRSIDLPENCHAYYFGSVCAAVVCEVGGELRIYDCADFGL